MFFFQLYILLIHILNIFSRMEMEAAKERHLVEKTKTT